MIDAPTRRAATAPRRLLRQVGHATIIMVNIIPSRRELRFSTTAARRGLGDRQADKIRFARIFFFDGLQIPKTGPWRTPQRLLYFFDFSKIIQGGFTLDQHSL